MLMATTYHENLLFPTAFVKSSDRNSLCCACDGCKDRSCDAFFYASDKNMSCRQGCEHVDGLRRGRLMFEPPDSRSVKGR